MLDHHICPPIMPSDFADFADLIIDCGYDNFKDFQKNIDLINQQELIDEFNLFYVAITRAKKALIKDSENFHYLLSKNISKLIDARISESKKDVNDKSIKKTKMYRKIVLKSMNLNFVLMTTVSLINLIVVSKFNCICVNLKHE